MTMFLTFINGVSILIVPNRRNANIFAALSFFFPGVNICFLVPYLIFGFFCCMLMKWSLRDPPGWIKWKSQKYLKEIFLKHIWLISLAFNIGVCLWRTPGTSLITLFYGCRLFSVLHSVVCYIFGITFYYIFLVGD